MGKTLVVGKSSIENFQHGNEFFGGGGGGGHDSLGAVASATASALNTWAAFDLLNLSVNPNPTLVLPNLLSELLTFLA